MQPNKKPLTAETDAASEKKKHTLWDSPVFLSLASVLCGILVWLIVTMYFDPDGAVFITNATVNFSYQTTAYTTLGLDIVDKPDVGNVRVKVEGNSTIIGNIKAADIMVYPTYSNVKGAGEAALDLEARIVNSDYSGNGVKVTVESPTTIDVVFDTVSEKTLPVTADTGKLSIADGYILNRSVSVPAEVTLRGPTSELDQIASVAAPVTADTTLSDSTSLSSVLELRDDNGKTITPEYTTMDSETANVALTVYQVRELPLTVDFIDAPTGFDTGSLKYSLSYTTMRVAGPAKTVSALNTLSVTSFDLAQEFAFDRDYQRQIELPSGLISQDGITTVTLSFDTTAMDSTTLNISNIRPINVPSTYDISVLTSMIRDVRLYGPADEIAELTADSVLAQIDCQSISVTAGQQTIPVTIQIPASSRIFATGSYAVQCEITAK